MKRAVLVFLVCGLTAATSAVAQAPSNEQAYEIARDA
jgi:hypothetical protein